MDGQQNWLTQLGAIAGIGIGIINAIRRPSPTVGAVPTGQTGVVLSTGPSGVALTTSPIIVVAAIAGLVVVVWMVTQR